MFEQAFEPIDDVLGNEPHGVRVAPLRRCRLSGAFPMRFAAAVAVLLTATSAWAESFDASKAEAEVQAGEIAAGTDGGPGAATTNYARKGPYVGLGFAGALYTQAEADEKQFLRSIGYVVDVDYDLAVGLDARAGYRFHPRAAAEIHFQWLPNTDFDLDGKGFSGVGEVDAWTLTADIKGYLLTNRLQPYVVAGLGYMHQKLSGALDFAPGRGGSDGDFAARVGGGIDYYLTERILFEIELGGLIPMRDLSGRDQFTFAAGLQARF